MDGKTVQRMRLLARENAELKAQNVALSANLLQMGGRIDGMAKSTQIDRLLVGALIRQLADDGDSIEIPIAAVDALRRDLAERPRLATDVKKDAERGVWVVRLFEKEPEREAKLEPANEPRSRLVLASR